GRLTTVLEDPAGLKYTTSYQYDVLDNLKVVTQGSQTRTFSYDSLKRLDSATNPESGTTAYVYDAAGNLKTKTDARSIAINYNYDALNRLLTRTYPAGTPNVTYTYDTAVNGVGHLASVAAANGGGTAYTAYDAMGNVTASTQTIAGSVYPFSYSYTLA